MASVGPNELTHWPIGDSVEIFDWLIDYLYYIICKNVNIENIGLRGLPVAIFKISMILKMTNSQN